MAKAPKIVDVQGPEKTVPTATSRPIIVTDRPVLANDPMVVAGQATSAETSAETPQAVQPPTRTAKTITPLHENVAPEPSETETNEPAAEPEPTADKSAEPEHEPEPTKTEENSSEPTEPPDPERDAEAETAAAETEQEAARTARAEELEQLIASGKYALPLNAVHRRRSRMYVLVFFVLAVVLALVLADAALDAGVVKAPSSIPHTHFFSTTV